MDFTGRKLGKYEMIEMLGQGGMAQVYKARQPLIDRLVAIMVMLQYLESSTKFLERFLQEAQRLGKLRHPNIVSVLDFDNLDGTQFIVMDYISGPSLRSYLTQKVRLPPQEALRIAIQILDALQYAHERGVVHCDLNPANVMFQDETCKQVVLTDFGIARLMDSTGQAQTSTVIGTPAYMSPEALDGRPFDGRTDLYALGVMLYEMVTGDQPYIGDTPVSVILKHMQEPPPDLRKTHPELPAGYAQLVEKAMAKEPAQRYASAADMRRAAESVLRRMEGGTSADLSTSTDTIRSAALASSSPTIRQGTTNPPIPRMDVSRVSPLPEPDSTGSVPVQRGSRRVRLSLGLGLAALGVFFVLILAVLALFLGRNGLEAQAATILTPTAVSVAPATATIGLQAAPTNPVVLPPTTAPVPTTTSQEVPQSEANSVGTLSVEPDGNGKPAYLLALIEPAPQPPSGSEYVLWISDGTSSLKLGSLALQDGQARLLAPVDSSALGTLRQAVVTVEPQGASSSAPTGPIVFSGQFSQGRLAEFRQLALGSSESSGKPYVMGILDQLLAAYDHQMYNLDALKNGDVKMGRAHAEHVINILEGKGGQHFGDADGSGTIENPGDDVGVLRYVSQARAHVLAAAAADPQTQLRQTEANDVAAQLDAAQKNIQNLVNLDVQLLATNNDADRLALAQQAATLMENLILGDKGLGGIWSTGYSALQVVSLPLIGSEGQGSPAMSMSGATGSNAMTVARLRVSDTNDVSMQIDGIPAAPTGFSYALWAAQDAGKGYTLMGVAPAGAYELQGKAPNDFWSAYKDVVLSLEPAGGDTPPAPQQPTRVVLSGALISPAGQFLATLMDPNQGALAKAEEQAALAKEHMDYLEQALQQNDLALAKRHAEHVINILEGKDGPNYGDFNGDGVVQDPGDTVGVLGYLKQIEAQAHQLQQLESLTAEQQTRLDQLLKVEQATVDLISANADAAQKIVASDTVNEAQGNEQSFATLVQAVLAGQDSDKNGAIDPLTGEGGLQAIQQLAAALGEIELYLK
jgi:serine/threonine protein kinase/anti-sigma-K factor RskA